MSASQMMASHLTMLDSFESEVIRKDPTENLGGLLTPEESGMIAELTNGIGQAVGGVVAMEALLTRFKERGNYSQESVDDYRFSMESVIIAANLQIAAHAITPSFESDNPGFDYSAEAEEQAKGTINAIWTWVKAKFKALSNVLGQVGNRLKVKTEVIKKDAAATSAKLTAAPEFKEKDITLSAERAKMLTVRQASPGAKPSAMTFQAAANEFIKGVPTEFTTAINGFIDGVKSGSLEKVKASAKTKTFGYLSGTIFLTSGGDEPGQTFKAEYQVAQTPANPFTAIDPKVSKPFVDKFPARLTALAKESEDMIAKLRSLESAATPSANLSHDDALKFKSSISRIGSALIGLMGKLYDAEIKMYYGLRDWATESI